MKFDPFSWDEVKTNVQVEVGKGRVRLQLSAPAPLYIEAEGVEALAGYGAAHDVEVSEAVNIRIDAPKGVRAFLFRAPRTTAVQPVGEVYTNIDRMTQESGTMLEITRARREFEIERRVMLREMKIANAQMKAEIAKARHAGTPADNPLDAASEVVELDDDPAKQPPESAPLSGAKREAKK